MAAAFFAGAFGGVVVELEFLCCFVCEACSVCVIGSVGGGVGEGRGGDGWHFGACVCSYAAGLVVSALAWVCCCCCCFLW